MTDGHEITVRLVAEISAIDAADWDQCANPVGQPYHPFVAHAFLKALEDANCVGAQSGWLPRHLVMQGADGTIEGVAPCYVKTHSQGEFVFDYAWADAYAQAGGRYYPKLQIAIPFTPVPGPRLLVRDGPQASSHRHVLGAAALEVARQNGMSSVHLTFLQQETQQQLLELGYLARVGQQYHWRNEAYTSFDDFLSTFASRKRKAVRKERIEALSSGIIIEQLRGDAITEAHWDAFYAFYVDTGDRKWGRPYLNRAFFARLGASMPEHCLLVMAKRGDKYIAGALNMIGGDCLYGRYWGAIEQHPFLHFEVCYYQAIDYAIAHKLARVEAGAQGNHKLARGYMPTDTYSSHWLADPGLHKAVAHFLDRERQQVAIDGRELAELGPYRKG